MADDADSCGRKHSKQNVAPKPRSLFFGRFKGRMMLGVLAVLTVISFLFGFGGVITGLLSPEDGKGTSGAKLVGAPVSRADIATAKENTWLELKLSGLRLSPAEASSPEFERMAWNRLAALRAGQKLGLATGVQELKDEIQKQFDVDGKFDPALYRDYLMKLLGVSPATFENYLGERLTLAKLRDAIGAAAWVTPLEMERETRRYTDTVEVQFALLSLDTFTAGVEPTVDETRTFYDANLEMFREPARRSVLYVALPVSNYVASATNISADDIQRYYDANLEEKYTVVSSNSTKSYVELKEVRDEIARTLALQAGAEAAEDAAMEFVTKHLVKAADFHAAASAAGLQVFTSSFFARYEAPEGILAGPEFNEEAFDRIDKTEDSFFSNPIMGDEHAYVIGYHDARESFVAPFDAVSNKVFLLAREEKREKTLRDKAEEIRAGLRASIKNGDSFTNAVKTKYGIEAMETGVFTPIHRLTNTPYAPIIEKAVLPYRQGEIAAPAAYTNGLVLSYVSRRTPGPPEAVQNMMPWWIEPVRRERADMLFLAWQRSLTRAEKVDELITSASAASNAPVSSSAADFDPGF